MHHATWVRPKFSEINLSAEIGMYFEDHGDRRFGVTPPGDQEPKPALGSPLAAERRG